MPSLFDPIDFGVIHAKNRVVMAPLTRARAGRDGVPTPLMAEYYAQRASAGLIISEATAVSQQGKGWVYAPGLWTKAQIEAWKRVTGAVHGKGGKIICQLWHMGRMAHSINTGEPIVAPSASTAPGTAHTYEGKKPYEEARALTVEEIAVIVRDFGKAAKNAIEAGFDGIQLHAANGYLIDEFLRESTNHRNDAYGGTPEKRLRFLSEILDATISAIGAEHVGVRFSPNGEIQDAWDSNPEAVFVPAAKMLDEKGIAWLELRESSEKSTFVFEDPTTQAKLSPKIRKVFSRSLVLNQDYTPKEAEAAIESGRADAISFGRRFISNPDLVERLQKNLPLADDDMSTWYGAQYGSKGYTDYPTAG